MSYDEIIQKIKEIAENYNEEPIGGWISGDGPIPCDILFVGEAPGKTEVEEGKPFVGMAGKTFEEFLNSIDLTRAKVRITNTCFVRPIKLKESKNGRTTTSNRPPKPKEIEMFRDILDAEISLVDPKIIITLGNVPLKRLTQFKSIGECHGQLYYNDEIKRHIFPMYHPSALTYNRNDEFMKMYSGDWQKLKTALEKIK
jgi:uracil-DNA glycosylase family 4